MMDSVSRSAGSPPAPITRSLLTIHVHELDTGQVWGEVIRDGEQLTELTEDSVPELLDGFAEILEDVTFEDT